MSSKIILKDANSGLPYIIGHLNGEKVVVLFSEKACRIFHKNTALKYDESRINSTRVVYFDCNAIPDCVETKKWSDLFMTIHGVQEVGDSRLATPIIEQRSISNKEYYIFKRD